MRQFVLNRHGKLIFPSNVFSELDFFVITSQTSRTWWCGVAS